MACLANFHSAPQRHVDLPAVMFGCALCGCEYECVCVQGFLPTLACAVFCKTHENIIFLPPGINSFNL